MRLKTLLFVSVLSGCVDSAETDVSTQELSKQEREGKHLFFHGTFGGNGTTCTTCHPNGSEDGGGRSGSLNPEEIQALFDSDPTNVLFQHDRADTLGGNTFDRLRQHATILVEIPLPKNVRIVGSTARSVILNRGIPSTMNTPALDAVLMLDGRAPNLSAQAAGAIGGHAQGTATSDELAAIAAFERTLFNRPNLRKFFERGDSLEMPYGTTDEEIRGRRWFIADDQTDPGQVGENTAAVCGWCHSGPFLNGASGFFATKIAPNPLVEGHRFFSVRVSEFNTMGNRTYTWQVLSPTGTVLRTAVSPDPGAVLNTGNNGLFNQFKSTTLWGTRDTAPYFHDNSAKTIEQMMTHYDRALNVISSGNPKVGRIIDLTDQDKADIAAYLRLL